MNCPTPEPSSAHYSQSCKFLQHLPTAAFFRKAEILSNLATFGNICLRCSQDLRHSLSYLSKGIAFDSALSTAKPAAQVHKIHGQLARSLLTLCPAMGFFDPRAAVSKNDVPLGTVHKVQHLQAQDLSQERQLQGSNLCTEQEKQVVLCWSKVSILLREKPVR